MADELLIKDKLGNPICINAKVAVCVMAYRHASLKWGFIQSYDSKTKQVSIKGGSLGRTILRTPSETIIIFMPCENNIEFLKD